MEQLKPAYLAATKKSDDIQLTWNDFKFLNYFLVIFVSSVSIAIKIIRKKLLQKVFVELFPPSEFCRYVVDVVLGGKDGFILVFFLLGLVLGLWVIVAEGIYLEIASEFVIFPKDILSLL